MRPMRRLINCIKFIYVSCLSPLLNFVFFFYYTLSELKKGILVVCNRQKSKPGRAYRLFLLQLCLQSLAAWSVDSFDTLYPA